MPIFMVELEICDLFFVLIDLNEYQRFFYILKFEMNCDVCNKIFFFSFFFFIILLLLSDRTI